MVMLGLLVLRNTSATYLSICLAYRAENAFDYYYDRNELYC